MSRRRAPAGETPRLRLRACRRARCCISSPRMFCSSSSTSAGASGAAGGTNALPCRVERGRGRLFWFVCYWICQPTRRARPVCGCWHKPRNGSLLHSAQAAALVHLLTMLACGAGVPLGKGGGARRRRQHLPQQRAAGRAAPRPRSCDTEELIRYRRGCSERGKDGQPRRRPPRRAEAAEARVPGIETFKQRERRPRGS